MENQDQQQDRGGRGNAPQENAKGQQAAGNSVTGGKQKGSTRDTDSGKTDVAKNTSEQQTRSGGERPQRGSRQPERHNDLRGNEKSGQRQQRDSDDPGFSRR